MLKIENLSASYKTIDGNIHVVKDVNFEIRDNEINVYSHVIPGPGGMPVGTNGSGMLLLSGGIDSPVAVSTSVNFEPARPTEMSSAFMSSDMPRVPVR